MSQWTHVICAPCWHQRHPDRPVESTVRMVEQYRSDERCCFCREITSAGIYVREDPTQVLCYGSHDDEALKPENKQPTREERLELCRRGYHHYASARGSDGMRWCYGCGKTVDPDDFFAEAVSSGIKKALGHKS
jgi:hypothetical protein